MPGLTGSGDQPPDSVIAAFGGRRPAVALSGGQGRTFVAGDIVLKPVGFEAEAAWAAQVLSTLEEDGFRVARPRGGSDGAWVVGGWTAFEWVEGEHRTCDGPWPDVVEACGRFHAGLASVPRPPWLERRRDHFAEADRLAWDERSADLPAPVADAVARLRALIRPVEAPSQVVHGDFAGNVLFADGLPPAVIDFSPYWRPAGYPTALTVVDAVLWYGEGVSLAARAASVPELDQLLVRALLFRLTVDGLQLLDRAPGVRGVDAQVDGDLGHAEPLLRHLEQRQQRSGS